jgi:hypothetical protein
MANIFRGEVPFKALGRDFFVRYGTREIAEVQAALGFHRPDPFLPEVAEEIDEPVTEHVDGKERPKLDASGQVFRRERRLVDADTRQRRMLSAFEATMMNPDPEAVLVFFRASLRPWERSEGHSISDATFHALVDALGMVRLKELHMGALAYGVYLKGLDQVEREEGEGKAAAASASSI